MSAVAAPAAGMYPRGGFSGTPRRRLQSVPAQAGPVVPLELGNPLQLTEAMRTRLLAAVRALVSDPALKGAGDPARLAAVVLMAKARVSADFSTRITARELGRWVGLKPSRIAHHVLPQLRDRGVLGSKETVSEAGRMTGLEGWVIPMYRAQHGGDRGHVLALSRVELVVLLKLIETLFAPGWEHKDGRTTPAGMLADRTGRGAATDRLGLLLMVLSSNPRGWLQLCSGSVDTERGRPAATVARLLGCSAAAGAKVLARLQEQNVLSVDRRDTASGLNARSRVRLLPVAQAHGVAIREACEAADAVFSDLAGTASGDHEAAGDAVPPVVTGVQSAGEGPKAESADRADAAHLHTSHASVVTPVCQVELSGGFSGEGRGGDADWPDRARVREDGPLRGEKPKESRVDGREGQRAAGAVAAERPKAMGWERARQQRRVDLPSDLGPRVALGPVAGLWERLSGWQQGQVEAAAQAELTRLAGMLDQPERASQLLADRLTDRLEETGGEALVDKPYGWLIRRGLVQRQACSDRRCDDGIRLDTGGDCASCASLLADRRAVRARVRTETAVDLPGAGATELRAACERRLREHTVLEAERTRLRHARAVVEVEGRRAAAAQRREREVAADWARRSAACVECGLPEAAGLCPPCSYARRTDLLVQEAVDLVVAVRADLDDVEQVVQLTARCEADTRTLIAEASRRRSGDEVWVAYAAQEVAERVRDERRAAALRRLAGSGEAVAEADAAYEAALRQRPRALQAAEAAADDACRRTAGYLLRSWLGQLQVVRARAAAGRAHHRAV